MLDCDGVLNSSEFFEQWLNSHNSSNSSVQEFKRQFCVHNGYEGYVVPELLGNLNFLCDSTQCKIVWTSSWREKYWERNQDTGDFSFNWHEIAVLWKAKGFPLNRLIGCTPCLDCSRFSYVPRGLEIQSWIGYHQNEYNNSIKRIAILDDNPDAEIGVKFESTRFFQTTSKKGLTKEITNQVVNWLNETEN